MPDFVTHLQPVPVGDFVTKLVQVFETALQSSTVREFSVTTNFGGYKLIEAPTKISDVLSAVHFKERLAHLNSRPFLDIVQVYLAFQGPPRNWMVKYKEDPEKACGVLTVTAEQELQAPDFFSLIDSLQKHFTLLKRVDVIKRLFPENEQRLMALSHDVISDFASEAAKLSQTSASSVQALHEQIVKKTVDLDQVQSKKLAELEETYQAKHKDLQAREAEFSERVKEFDLRNNTAVRRQIFENLNKAIEAQKDIVISSGTSRKRNIIHGICGTIMGIAVLGFWFIAKDLKTGQPFDWHLLLPLTTTTLIFGSTAIFYMRWNNQWFTEHSRAEFANRKFKADMLRAGWLVEMFFHSHPTGFEKLGWNFLSAPATRQG